MDGDQIQKASLSSGANIGWDGTNSINICREKENNLHANKCIHFINFELDFLEYYLQKF